MSTHREKQSPKGDLGTVHVVEVLLRFRAEASASDDLKWILDALEDAKSNLSGAGSVDEVLMRLETMGADGPPETEDQAVARIRKWVSDRLQMSFSKSELDWVEAALHQAYASGRKAP